MTETTPATDKASKPSKTFSCVRCFERKVKCDREHPCSGCMRSGVECIFRVPAPPRRKKKRTQEDILTERLNQYEQILQQKGIDIQNVPIDDDLKKTTPAESQGSTNVSETVEGAQTGSTQSESDPRSFVTPRLVWEDSRSRYTENNLWTRVTEEIRQSQGAIHESSEEEDSEEERHEPDDNIDFTLGWTPGSTGVRSLHPVTEHVMVLWEIFLENVNPFSKIVHRPTMQASIEKALINIDHIPRGLEAMMFAIYSAAVMSMPDRDVENTFGETRKILLLRYRTATKAALARAKFMGSSDMLVIQAFVLHLLSMRDVYDGRTLWTLSGVAIRIAEGMGIHRDGTILGLPPFRTEMRRRLWYQITTLDYRSAELSGLNKYKLLGVDETMTKPPLNINDEDMWPDMKESPVPHVKTTEMVLCCMRYEFSSFWAEKFKRNAINTTIWENYKTIKTMEDQDAAINELERHLEDKYIRYCDPTKPIELAASLVARSATSSMRLMAHHPRRWKSEDQIPESERELLWALCIRILEGYTMAVTMKSLQRFSWHTSFYFQWQALIYLLDCIRADPLMARADDAWKHVANIFDVHPHFITDTKKAIHIAIGGLCLKAYVAREQAFKKEGRFLPARPPEYIRILRRQREAAQEKQAERKAKLLAQSQAQNNPATNSSGDIASLMGFETSPQMYASQNQWPIPPFQNIPADTQQQQSQQDIPFWFDSFRTQFSSNNTDWMMMQDPVMDQGTQMDWSQWDYLLEDGGGAIGGTIGGMR